MRKLTDVPNTNGVTANFPKGSVRDKVGVTPGTTGGEILFGDIIQFFQKLVIDSGVVENDLQDQVVNGYQLIEAMQKSLLGGFKPPVIKNIGDWDMDADASVSIAHGLADFEKIRKISVLIRNDAGTELVEFSDGQGTPGSNGSGNVKANATNIVLTRGNSTLFDDAAFDDTPFNRGWIVIEHIF